MSTIIGDWRRKIIVTDSQVSDDDSDTKNFQNEKVFRVPQGLLAGAGDFISIQQVVDYFMEGKKGKPPVIKDADDADFMLLSHDGLYVSGKDLRFQKIPTYEVLGSGSLGALAVLALGHTAEEACWATCRSDLYSGGDVRVYSLDSKEFTTWTRDAN